MRVLIVGSATRDLNVHEGIARRAFGGTVLYSARTYAALGVDCRVLTSAARADRAAIVAALPAAVEPIVLPAAATTAFENTYLADGRRVQRAPALAPPLPYLDDVLDGVDFVHLGPLHPDDLDPAWYACRRALSALDLQGLTRRVVEGDVQPAADPRLPQLLPAFAWLKGSVREWRLVEAAFGEALPNLAPASERLFTRGIDGGIVADSGGESRWDASPPVAHCDPTGAGDVYFAAYLVDRNRGAAPGAAASAAARFTSAFLAAKQAQTA